jgi:hypothetical protein
MARGLFKFWLDYDKDDELLIAEEIDRLKQNRLFAQTIRDGIRLICDLRAGRVDVLFELFPWVKAEFIAGVQPAETPGERYLREQLDRIERQLTEQRSAPPALPSGNPKPLLGGPKPLVAPKLAPPKYDDEDEALIAIRNDTSTESAMNFLKSAFALQQ